MDELRQAWTQFVEHHKETALLSSIQSLLTWDERTGMPVKAADYRAEQVAYLAGKIHERRTAPCVGEWLEVLAEGLKSADPHGDQAASVRETKRQFDKQSKLPQRLVEELTRAEVLGQQAWVKARQEDDYSAFQPYLETNLKLRREQASAIGYEASPYDVLLDDYEPGENSENLKQVLRGLREALVPLIAELGEAKDQPVDDFLRQTYPVERQEQFGTHVATRLGFDFSRGRLDITDHPFCTEIGPHDHRILTRYNPKDFSQAFYGILHEAGHGIYDQGLRPDQYGLPSGAPISLGIHESQSRLWENMVGRSLAFWEFFHPVAQEHFPDQLGQCSPKQMYDGVNVVRPSLIRVEADEATYNLHIAIRFDLEKALIEGELPSPDLPAAWNQRYRDDLGIEPPGDGMGVLQDVHWSAALFGYFPTYSLGNLYAAHWMQCARQDLGDLDQQFRQGEFLPLRDWLAQNIYQHGQCFSARQLLERIDGQPLSHEPLLNYLSQKLRPIYGLSSS
ncbi:MAG: carboxypeptidase M32 [Planctomycetota bacterium]|nr:carboxypeptidase M32 [Planctomycetota bacterium]